MLPDAARKRQDFFWSKLDTSSADNYEKSIKPLRSHFRNEIIGRLPEPTMPMNPRTRLIYDTGKFKGYEVVLDLYEDVICFGILLVPNDIKPGEKRPVVVCQHGLEGRPSDVCNPDKKTQYYNSFGADLANKGYIVFAPQNPYIFKNDFRQLVRKGHPLKISLYSFIYRQHERILDFLATLPYVDATQDRLLRPVLRRQGGDADLCAAGALLPGHLLRRFQRMDLEEHHAGLGRQLHVHQRIRHVRIRPGQHLQLRGDGRAHRPPAVHGGAWPQ